MLLLALAFLGGALTILSPCILPVLPFVFARQDRSFARGTLPLLAGMAVTFAAIATLAAVGGAWAVRVNSFGRMLALVLLAAFGVALLSQRVADWLARPFVAFGNRLLQSAGRYVQVLASAARGVATGFLWAPCAGPILGLILTGAALSGPSAQTTLLLFAYALGAISSLALAVFAGAGLLRAFKKSLGTVDWVRRGLGVAVLAGVVAIAAGWDTGLLTRLSFASTNRVEQSLIDAIHPPADGGAAQSGVAMQGSMTGSMTGSMSGSGHLAGAMTGAMAADAARGGPPVEGELPSVNGAVAWLNSAPLTAEGLRGRVVVIDFWTYSCINCLRTLPYLKAWNERYKDHGLTIIGVHAPEFAFEKDEANVRRAVSELGITYPVAIDNDYAIWRAFDNQYWPAHYFVDAQGRIRGHHFGEGSYEESEQLIRQLLTEAGQRDLPGASGAMRAAAIEIAPDESNVRSPETYVGYDRAENFASPVPLAKDQPASYAIPASLPLNQWTLGGKWIVGAESAVSAASQDQIVFRFHARDLHLVLGPGPDGKPIRFRVTIEGHEPGADHGADTDAHGSGSVGEQRLYQLIRQSGAIQDRTFSIEFLDPGVRAYSFTFG
jgi:cytochrome c biogenesis protein CcdA/thiol-disulfide isomerase/thioredoxin